MKKRIARILASVLAVVMLAAAMCGCSKSMKVKVSVKLGQDYIDYKYAEAKRDGNDDFIIPQNERTILNDIELRINYDDDDPVTVLRALREVCANTSIDFKMNASGQSIETIGNYSSFLYTPDSKKPIEGFDETLSFFWAFTVNGKEPEEGRVNNYELKDGDVLVFTLSAQGIEEEATE